MIKHRLNILPTDDIYRWCTQFNCRLQVFTKNAVVLERFAISGFTSQWWTVLSPGSCFKRRPVCWTFCDILDSLERCITRFCKCLWEAYLQEEGFINLQSTIKDSGRFNLPMIVWKIQHYGGKCNASSSCIKRISWVGQIWFKEYIYMYYM